MNSSINNDLEKIVQEEYQDYISSLNDLANSAAGNKGIKRVMGNMLINVIGIFLPVTTALTCGLDFYNYFKDRKKYGFVLFMNSLTKLK